MLLDQLHWLPGDVLMKADRAGMQVSLRDTNAVPDHRASPSSPPRIPRRPHATRREDPVTRRSSPRLVPDSATARPKTAFRVPAGEWLRAPGPDDGAISSPRARAFENGWFRPQRRHPGLSRGARFRRADRSDVYGHSSFRLWLDRWQSRCPRLPTRAPRLRRTAPTRRHRKRLVHAWRLTGSRCRPRLCALDAAGARRVRPPCRASPCGGSGSRGPRRLAPSCD